MRITQRPGDPSIWEFHEVSAQEQDEVTRFVEESRHGVLVNPYAPIAFSFTDPAVVEAFAQRFGRHFE